MQNARNSLCKKQWTIFMWKQWTVLLNAKNNEQFLCENSEQFYLMQKTDFMNAVSKFKYIVNMMGRVQILLM